jgi:hypothetical protein
LPWDAQTQLIKDTTLPLAAKTQPLNGETLPLTRATNLPSGKQTLPHIGILPLTSSTLPLDGGLIDRTLEKEEMEIDTDTEVELPNMIVDSKGSPNNKMETLQNLHKPFS